MAWHLVTAPDELERCCVVIDEVRCPAAPTHRISAGAWDAYTYTCAAHVELVIDSEPGAVAKPIER